jgi:ABC-type phosphate transport system substrate-binding protein
MAIINQNYNNISNNEYLKQFKKLIPENCIINKWYKINQKTFIYFNAKGFYHIAILKKFNYYTFYDYVLSSNGQLNFIKENGYFKDIEEVKNFLSIN